CFHQPATLNEYVPFTRWVSAVTTVHLTVYAPAFSGAWSDTINCFSSFASVAIFPVATFIPLWSRNSTLENFKTTASLKVSLISVGGAVAVPSAGGFADLSVGWAWTDVAIRHAANSATTTVEVVFNMALLSMATVLLSLGEGISGPPPS